MSDLISTKPAPRDAATNVSKNALSVACLYYAANMPIFRRIDGIDDATKFMITTRAQVIRLSQGLLDYRGNIGAEVIGPLVMRTISLIDEIGNMVTQTATGQFDPMEHTMSFTVVGRETGDDPEKLLSYTIIAGPTERVDAYIAAFQPSVA